MTTDTDTKQDTIQRPARAWRNWYVFTADFLSTKTVRYRAGEHVQSNHSHATKDMAEAMSWNATPWRQAMATGFVNYLGAFPEGTRP